MHHDWIALLCAYSGWNPARPWYGESTTPSGSSGQQVWSLAQLFKFDFFCQKAYICLEGKLMTSRRREYCSCSFKQFSYLGLRRFKGFLRWRYLQGPSRSPFTMHFKDTSTLSGVLSKARRSQDTFFNIWLKPWSCVCRKMCVCTIILDWRKANIIELVTLPVWQQQGETSCPRWCQNSTQQ